VVVLSEIRKEANDTCVLQKIIELGYSKKSHFEPRVGGEVRILGFYNNKQKKKTD